MGLIVVKKKSSKRPKAGDVFRVDLATEQVVWGRVVSTDATVGSATKLALLYFFRPRPSTEAPPASLPVDELLFEPVFTNNLGFSRGYFTVTENRPFGPGERLKTHCLKWIVDGMYHDETGAVLPGPVEPILGGGIHSFLSIEDAIARALGVPNPDEASAPVAPGQPLAETRFWSIIDAARARARKPTARASSLARELMYLPVEEIAAFDAAFAERMRRAHDWALWGAAYVLDDGCSEGAFVAFRAWLIFQGRDVFEGALKDPETLARFAGHRDFDAEEVLGVAKERFDAKSDDLFDPAPRDNAEPTGTPFDEATLAARYPRLAKAVGGG